MDAVYNQKSLLYYEKDAANDDSPAVIVFTGPARSQSRPEPNTPVLGPGPYLF